MLNRIICEKLKTQIDIKRETNEEAFDYQFMLAALSEDKDVIDSLAQQLKASGLSLKPQKPTKTNIIDVDEEQSSKQQKQAKKRSKSPDDSIDNYAKELPKKMTFGTALTINDPRQQSLELKD